MGLDDRDMPVNRFLHSDERGAAAIIVAASLVLLLGISAVAIDLGAGFNQRTEDQTAADLAALSAALNGMSEVNGVNAALETARHNLHTPYTDAEWQALWEGCTDPDMPASFSPVDDPWSSTAGVNLACISSGVNAKGQTEIRVRIPNEITPTAVGGVIGVKELNTHASAHAGFEYNTGGSVMPFGVLYGTPMGGESCVAQPPGGHGVGACTGPSAGSFGGINLPIWGNTAMGTTVDCNPGAPEFSQNIAIGSDHVIAPAFGGSDLNTDGTINADDWPGTGGSHPGDADIVNNSTALGKLAKLDACTGDPAVASDTIPAFPLNTVEVDTGFSGNDVKLGLIGDEAYQPSYPWGSLPRLQQTTNSDGHTFTIVEKKVGGGSNPEYVIDNNPLWRYLRDPADIMGVVSAIPSCNRTDIETAYTTTGWSAARALFVGTCLPAYVTLYGANPSTAPALFTDDLALNPRFAWAPEFQYTDWGSGTGWQPIHDFVAMYIDGIWFNCNGKDTGVLDEDCGNKKGLEFYPGEEADGSVHTGKPGGGGATRLRLDQVTALMVPAYALPESIAGSYPGSLRGPFTTNLLR